MANRTVTLTGTTVGTTILTVDIYHTSVDGANLIAAGVTRAQLLAGYSFVDDDSHTTYIIVSDSPCNSQDTVVFSVTPSPTPTSTTSVTPTPSISVSVTPSISVSVTPTPSITGTAGASPTPTNTPTITPSNTASVTPTITPSNTASVTPTITPSNTASVTPSVTSSITPTPSITNTPGVSQTPTITLSPSSTVTPTSSVSPTVTPSNTASVTPTLTPSNTVTVTPTITPSNTASVTPSITSTPGTTPSNTPSLTPTVTPSTVFYEYRASLIDCCTESPYGDTNIRVSAQLLPNNVIVISSNCYRIDNLEALGPEPIDHIITEYYTDPADCTTCLAVHPCPSPTSTPTNTITPTATLTPTPTASITATPSLTPTVTPTSSPTEFYYLMSPCDGVSPNFVAKTNAVKSIGTQWLMTGSGYDGVQATIISTSTGPWDTTIGVSTVCGTASPTPTPTMTPTPSITPSITPTQQYTYYVMSPCDGVSPNFVARGMSNSATGVYEVSGSGYAGVKATIISTTSGPSYDATLLAQSTCGPSPTPSPTPTRTPTSTPSYNYYTVRSLRPDCTGLLPGTNEILKTTQTLSTGNVVGPSPGSCYEVQGSTTSQTPDYTGPWTVFANCGTCQTP